MDGRISKRDTLGRMSVFDLDALREAFRRSVRDNNIPQVDWAKHAELFVKSAAHPDSGAAKR